MEELDLPIILLIISYKNQNKIACELPLKYFIRYCYIFSIVTAAPFLTKQTLICSNSLTLALSQYFVYRKYDMFRKDSMYLRLLLLVIC